MDQSSRGVIRIESVQILRERQFSEDSGPNAHPIRPSDCYAVDNFFTATIYEKGSEIIRMMQTMVGRPGFKKGMDLYFQRHDGQAVIIEDFAKAISDANNQQWDQFKLWYSQAGTPHVIVKESFDTGTGTYCLDFEQSCALTSREKNDPEFLKIGKHPFHIPMVFALLDSSGKEISIDNQIKNNNLLSVNSEGETLFHLRTQTARISFTGFEKKPTLSLNRNFSAPIHLDIKTQNESDLLFLMKHDQDPFNRWEASQRLYLQTLKQQLLADQKKQNFEISPGLVEGIQSILSDSQLDTGMKAELILLPRLDYWVQMEKNIDGLYHF